jgi:hypothetical protein
MLRKSMLAALSMLTALMVIVITAALTPSANAKDCWYQGVNSFTQPKTISSDIKGHGIGLKMSRACKRAKRHCLTKLRRAWKKGKAQHFACMRVGDTPGF